MRRTLAAAIAAFGLFLFAVPAMAMDPISIPLTTVVRGDEGEAFVLAEVPTGTEAGCEADVVATAGNNPSVHVGNNLIVSSGDGSVTLADVEREPNAVTSASGTLTLGDTVTVTLVLGPADPGRPISVFSGGITVTITCVPVETTTTTVSTTTTTEATTTTTEATTTTMPTTTTTPPSTTIVPNTTTTPPPGVSSTVLTTTTTVPPVTGSTLPFTGPEDMGGWAMAGGALILLGSALVLALRQADAAETR